MFCGNIDIDALEYKAPTNNRSGGKVVGVSTVAGSNDWKDRLRFQMSESDHENLQTAVWGLATPLPGQDAARRTLELSVESPALESFLQRMDEKNVQTALDKAPEWFRKELDRDQITNMYVTLLKPSAKQGMKPTVRVKVKCGADYPTNVYVVQGTDEHGDLMYTRGTQDDLTRHAKCLVMAETGGLWFMSRQFGMSFVATDIMVWPSRRATGIDAFTLSSHTRLKLQDERVAATTEMMDCAADE